MHTWGKKKLNRCREDILCTNPADPVSVPCASDSMCTWLPACLGNGDSSTLFCGICHSAQCRTALQYNNTHLLKWFQESWVTVEVSSASQPFQNSTVTCGSGFWHATVNTEALFTTNHFDPLQITGPQDQLVVYQLKMS